MKLVKSRPNTTNNISKLPHTILVQEKKNDCTQSIDPSNPFGVISRAVIFDKQMEDDIRKRVKKLVAKIQKLKKQKNILTQENGELLEKILKLESDELYSASSINRINISKLIDCDEIGEEESVAQQSVAVRRLMKGYVDEMQKLEGKFMELHDDNTNDDSVNVYGLKERYKLFIEWIEVNLPLSDDIQWAFLNYGLGISAFFSFYRFVVLNTFIIFAAYCYFLIKQLIHFNAKYSDMFEYGLPQFTMFSMFKNSNGSVYALSSIVFMIITSYTSLNKWIKENKKQITAQLLTTKSDTNNFASLSLVPWDFSKYKMKETNEQKQVLTEEFRLLLQNEELINIKQNRSKKEKYILFCRRSLGIMLNLAFVIGSWYAIFMIISTQQYVIEELSKVIGDVLAKAIHPSVAIIFVGLILPTITFAITGFEKWETKIQTMKNQIWRLYFGRIANLIVAGIPAYIMYDDIYIVSYTLSDPVDALIGKNNADNTYSIFKDNKYLCFEDVAAYYLIKLVITDFLIGKCVKIFTYYAKQFVNTFTKYKLAHSPYNVAESIIEILYTQGLIWFTLPLYPFLAILAPFLMYCNFKFEKYVLSKFKGKMDASWKAEETGSFFIIFYNLTLVVGLIVNYYFLKSEWPCYGRVSESQLTIDTALSIKQGPFASIDPSQPWNSVEQWMEDHHISYLLNVFDNALLFMIIAITITLRSALRDNMNQAQTQLLELKDKEIDELYKKLWAQKRRLELQRNESIRSAMK